MITFGPVPSRRLGNSLGINNIPPKKCSYSCVYCQLGRTDSMKIDREKYYDTGIIKEEIEKKIKALNEKIDYLTFVPDGEPTLDIDLGKKIHALKELGYKIAVITNSSLIWREDVRNDLALADWVSIKMDAASAQVWHKIDRPHGLLELEIILKGALEFSKIYKGELVTETMMIEGLNDNAEEIQGIAEIISNLNCSKSYLSIPTRPPAENWVKAASEDKINMAYHIFKEHSIDVEYLIGYEGNEFALTGNVEDDILSITSVHPMRKDAVEELLLKSGNNWDIVENMLSKRLLMETDYKGNKFYLRNLHHNH